MISIEEKRALIEHLADSPTALICNAYSFMGSHAPCADWTIRCMTPDLPPMVGEAITVKLDCSTPDGEHVDDDEGSAHRASSLYYEMVEQMQITNIPKVVVIESIGNKSTSAVLGDGMAKLFRAAGASGCVTDGGIRDINDVRKTGLTTFGGGSVANHYRLRWSNLGEPVTMGGLKIETGSIVHGDRDGVIVVPQDGWASVVRACRVVMDFEKAAHGLLRSTALTVPEKQSKIGALADVCANRMRNGTADDFC